MLDRVYERVWKMVGSLQGFDFSFYLRTLSWLVHWLHLCFVSFAAACPFQSVLRGSLIPLYRDRLVTT